MSFRKSSFTQEGMTASGSFSGSFVGDGTNIIGGSSDTASYVAGADVDGIVALATSASDAAFDDVRDKPTLVSASIQVDHDATLNFVGGQHFLQSAIIEVGTVVTGDVDAILPVGTLSASAQIKGQLDVTGITGSLLGTASWADDAVTASFALNAGGGAFLPLAGGTLTGDLIVNADAHVSGNLKLSSAQPHLQWVETDGAADNKNWDMRPSAENFLARAVSDDFLTASIWLEVNRTGITIDTINLQATNLQHGGTDVSLDGHTHTVSEVTDFDPTDYLLLTGGTLTGALTMSTGDNIVPATNDGSDLGTTALRWGVVRSNVYHAFGESAFNYQGPHDTGTIILNMGLNYAWYADDTGAGTDDTRVWFDTPDRGELVLGPRSGANFLDQVRIRSRRVTFESDVSASGAGTKEVEFNLDVQIRNGHTLQILDSGDTDHVVWKHDGTDFFLTATNTAAYRIIGMDSLVLQPNNRVDLQGGTPLRIRDGTDSDYAEWSHDGTDFNLLLVATVDYNITNLTGQMFVSGNLQLNTANPKLLISNTLGDADAKMWRMLAETGNGRLVFATRTDADGAGENWLTVNRTGTAITIISFQNANSLKLTDGMDLYVQDASNNGRAVWAHGGTDFNLNFIATTDYNITGLSGSLKIDGVDVLLAGDFVATSGDTMTGDLIMGDGAIFAIQDAGNTDSASFSHDGSNFTTIFNNTANWDILDTPVIRFNARFLGTTSLRVGEPSTTRGDAQHGSITLYGEDPSSNIGSFTITHGGSNVSVGFGGATTPALQLNINVDVLGDKWLQVRDSTNADRGRWTHDGTDFNLDCTNTTDYNITGITNLNVGGTAVSLVGHTHVVANITDFDPTDYLLLAGGTLTGDLVMADGGIFSIQDAGNTDSASFSHDGTDFRIEFNNTGVVRMIGHTGDFLVFGNGIRILNNREYKGRNQADSLDFGLIKLNTTDIVELDPDTQGLTMPAASQIGFQNFTKLQIAVGPSGSRWFRVGEINASGGRGTGRFHIAAQGGNITPFNLIFHVTKDWLGQAGINIIHAAGGVGEISSIRLAHNTGSNFCAVDVEINSDSEAGFLSTIYRDTAMNAAGAYVFTSVNWIDQGVGDPAGSTTESVLIEIAIDNNLMLAASTDLGQSFRVDDELSFNRGADAATTMILGEPTVLRGDTQQSFLDFYGENAGAIAKTQIGQSGANWQFRWLEGTVGGMQILDGIAVRIFDAGNTDYLQMAHDGTDFNSVFVNTALWDVTGLTDSMRVYANLRVLDGNALRVNNSANTDWGEWSHDGTNFNLDFVNTTDYNINNSVAALKVFANLHVREGHELRIWDSGDNDRAGFFHDGTDFNTVFLNTTDWNITGLTGSLKVANGGIAITSDSGKFLAGASADLEMYHDASNSFLLNNTGILNILQAANERMDFYTNNTLAMQIQANHRVDMKNGAEVQAGSLIVWTGTFQMGTAAGSSPGLASFRFGTNTGGWARGWHYYDSGSNIIGGIGVLGSNQLMTHAYMGYGANPHNSSEALIIRPGVIQFEDTDVSLAGHDHTVSEITDFDPTDYLPLTAGTNEKITGTLYLSAANPRLRLIETDGSSNNKVWDMLLNDDQLRFQMRDDAESASANWLEVDRSLNVCDKVNFLTTALQHNGADVVTDISILDKIGNVSISSIVANEILRWSGTFWVNRTLVEAGIAPLTLTTNGDVLYYNSGYQRLAKGTDDQVLTLVSGIPSWEDAAGGGYTDPLTTDGDILIRDTTTKRLAKGTDDEVLTLVSGLPSWEAKIKVTVSTSAASGGGNDGDLWCRI